MMTTSTTNRYMVFLLTMPGLAVTWPAENGTAEVRASSHLLAWTVGSSHDVDRPWARLTEPRLVDEIAAEVDILEDKSESELDRFHLKKLLIPLLLVLKLFKLKLLVFLPLLLGAVSLPKVLGVLGVLGVLAIIVHVGVSGGDYGFQYQQYQRPLEPSSSHYYKPAFARDTDGHSGEDGVNPQQLAYRGYSRTV